MTSSHRLPRLLCLLILSLFIARSISVPSPRSFQFPGPPEPASDDDSDGISDDESDEDDEQSVLRQLLSVQCTGPVLLYDNMGPMDECRQLLNSVSPLADNNMSHDELSAAMNDPASRVAWYSTSPAASAFHRDPDFIADGQVLPKSWTGRDCRLSVGWVHNTPPEYPIRMTPLMMKVYLEGIISQCPERTRHTRGEMIVPHTSIKVYVEIREEWNWGPNPSWDVVAA